MEGADLTANADYRRNVKSALRAERKREETATRERSQTLIAHRAKFGTLRKQERATKKDDRRRERKAQQRCDCCTDKQLQAFKDDARGRGLETDHILALGLGGAHCLKNMQALPHTEHLAKTVDDMRSMLAGRPRSDVKHRFAGRYKRKTAIRLIPMIV